MKLYKIKNLKTGIISHIQESPDANYVVKIPKNWGYDTEGIDYEIIIENKIEKQPTKEDNQKKILDPKEFILAFIKKEKGDSSAYDALLDKIEKA